MTSQAKLQSEADVQDGAVALRKTAVGRRENLSYHSDTADVATALPANCFPLLTCYGCFSGTCIRGG